MAIADRIDAETKQPLRLDKKRMPRHIAIIPDGNRRWAKQKGQSYRHGHQAGADAIIAMIKAAKEYGVETVTFYLFSTENWSRSKPEISALMWLLKNFLHRHTVEMQREGVKLQTIGTLESLPKNVRQAIAESKEQTACGESINMVFALNYGGRDDIVRAVQKIAAKCVNESLPLTAINEACIASHLDTAPWGDPELLIRTSGEQRISNFLLWQISYAELYMTDVLWPDFTAHHLQLALTDYQMRERRLGGS